MLHSKLMSPSVARMAGLLAMVIFSFSSIVTTAETTKETITFKSLDGLLITADYYKIEADKPVIVLCHQAGWSRGEYKDIALRLNGIGFNCLAIDQRSGAEVNEVVNETAQRAGEKNLKTDYLDAEKDIVAAVQWAAKKHSNVILWGSSYSASLVLKVAQDEKAVKKVLSFSPGEYFGQALNLKNSITKIRVPVFITCSRDEIVLTQSIFDVLTTRIKTFFKPDTKGNHGSKSLWSEFSDAPEYWRAVKDFLYE